MYRRYGDITWEASDGPTAVAFSPRPRTARRARRRPVTLPGQLLPSVHLHGVRLHAISERQCIDHILDELDAGRGGVVVTPNLDHIRRATRDMNFGALVAEADLVVADGMPLIWASRLQGTPLPQRVAGSDLISSLSATAATRGRSVFLLGGAPGTAEGAAEMLKAASPDLKIAGTYCPPFGFEHDDAEKARIMGMLVTTGPDIVFVALGSPKQENLIQEIRSVLPRAWWLGVGISFSFLCGEVKRAPRWVQKIGMEWLHRLLQDPRRLFHRYVVVGIPFGASLLMRSFIRGIPQRLRGGSDSTPIVDLPGDGNGEAFKAHAGASGNGNGHGAANDNGDAHGNGNGNGDAALEAPAMALPQRPRRRIVESGAGHSKSLGRLRAMVLLGGAVRSSALSEACCRSALDLPLDSDGSIFNHWLLGATDLARHAGLEKLPVRVMVNRNTPEPVSASPPFYGKFRVERDLSEYRGTGGVLRDLATDYDDDDLILVCNAAQILLDPLAAIATALDRKAGEFTLVSHADGTPSGVMLLSCKTLRLIPESGFVDLKEQALPLIASQYDVTVLHCRRPTGLAVRTLADYVVAMRHYHRKRIGKPATSDPLAEDWLPAFAIVEQGATVDPRAHVHDSVVLRGGVVEAGAVVVRSIVCPGGVVKKDRQAVDQLVFGQEQ